jgi:hypothetical protein
MRIKNINQVITNKGNTSDIINVVMYAYDVERDPQIKELAGKLKGNSDSQTCKNIWQYLQDNVVYHADSESSNGEMVKSPARLLVDGTGDCKSYSLFTAVILRWLGIPHLFRFVSYSPRPEATHVYVVAGGNIVIDAVAAVQLNKPFNTEIKYSYRCDMANSGTKISYLAGFEANNKKYVNPNGKRQFVAGEINATDPHRYDVWIGDENAGNVTPGKHFLYALMDLNIEMLNISKTTTEQLFYLDNLDIIASLLHAYNLVSGDTDEFRKIAHVICSLVTDGVFKSKELDVNARYDNLDDLYKIITESYNIGYSYSTPDPELWQMLETEVFPFNNVSKISGIAGESDVVSKTKESGIYFIYMFITNEDLAAMPEVVRNKLIKQRNTFDWMAYQNTYQKSSAIQLTVRSGIIARTGRTPEQFIGDLKAGREVNDVSIGFIDPASLLLYAKIIIALITIIKLLFPLNPKKPKPSDEDITAGTFDPALDFYKGVKSNPAPASTASFGTVGLLALGGAALYFLKK